MVALLLKAGAEHGGKGHEGSHEAITLAEGHANDVADMLKQYPMDGEINHLLPSFADLLEFGTLATVTTV